MKNHHKHTHNAPETLIQEVTLVDILKELYELRGKFDIFMTDVRRVEKKNDENHSNLEKRIKTLETLKSRMVGGFMVLAALLTVGQLTLNLWGSLFKG